MPWILQFSVIIFNRFLKMLNIGDYYSIMNIERKRSKPFWIVKNWSPIKIFSIPKNCYSEIWEFVDSDWNIFCVWVLKNNQIFF